MKSIKEKIIKNKNIIFTLSIAFLFMALVDNAILAIAIHQRDEKIVENQKEINDLKKNKVYKNIEIRYKDEYGNDKFLIGIIDSESADKLDTRHQKIYAYGIESIYTDNITIVDFK